MGVVERIRSLAAQNGHTIASVERVCGLSQGSIRKWDHAAPSADKLYKVAQMFNVTMEYLLIGGLQSTSQSETVWTCRGKPSSLVTSTAGRRPWPAASAMTVANGGAWERDTPGSLAR